METDKKSTATGTQLLIGKDSTAGKCRWSKGNEKAKLWWKRSAQMDGENKLVTIEYLLLSQKDSHLSHFRIPNLLSCARAAQWSSLRAIDFPLLQLSDLAWLLTLLFCGSADETGGLGDHGSNPQCSSRAKLHSTAVTWTTTVFSPFFLSPLIALSFPINKVPGGTAGSVKCHTCGLGVGISHPSWDARDAWVCPCVNDVSEPPAFPGATRRFSLTRGAADQPLKMPFSCLNTSS